jgi:asparagine synthase (glutamine-hydrolysing)
MCGIAGAVSLDGQPDPEKVVEAVVASQLLRGPDHRAIVRIPDPPLRLTLGHSRLVIVDPSPAAHQPLWDHERKRCLVFNGEIYNYLELRSELASRGARFLTRGDSEVILEAFKAWGAAGFERLSGMFAFALWDGARRELHMVRDRFGVKPLYYWADSERLLFGSTCEAIARQLDLAPDLEYIARGIRYWVYDDGDRSPFVGLRALRPGHRALAKLDSDGTLDLTVLPYYSLTERVAAKSEALRSSTETQVREELADLLERSVAVRMRSDFPVGLSLSGGLDSSLLAALSSTRGSLVGFTFGHPDDPSTEGPTVRQLCEELGLPVHYVRPDMDEIVAAFFGAVDAQGAPFPSASIVGQYLVYHAAREAGVRVVLGGQGGDEIFMGYRKFQYFYIKQLLRRGEVGKAMMMLFSAGPEFAADLRRAAVYWRARQRYTRSEGIGGALKLPAFETLEMHADPDRPLWLRQARDIELTSLPALLRYEDRNSMAHSVESRLPYLDYSLVEFALALDVDYKLRMGLRKWVMREYARGRIPESIRSARSKRGFDVAQNRWIASGLGAAIRGALKQRLPHIRDYLATDEIDRIFSDARLQNEGSAFTEATTLLWLGNHAMRTHGAQ